MWHLKKFRKVAKPEDPQNLSSSLQVQVWGAGIFNLHYENSYPTLCQYGGPHLCNMFLHSEENLHFKTEIHLS